MLFCNCINHVSTIKTESGAKGIFTLDFQSRQPIYDQLYREVTRMAALGVLEPGASLPSVRTLAQELGVNPNTVQKAYAMLERDGIIGTVPGKGSFLSSDGAAVAHQKSLAAEALREAARAAAESGLTKDEAVAAVSGFYEEGGGSR